jgi:hypothetical protein
MSSTDSNSLELHEIIDDPLGGMNPPYYSTADLFELFCRLDCLEAEIKRISAAAYAAEENRKKDLAALRKARKTIKRQVQPEEIFSKHSGQKPRPIGYQQQQLILDALVNAGFDPCAIPRKPGKSGIKRLIKTALLKEHRNVFRSESAFDNAWKVMRKNRVIADAPSNTEIT